ncbi:MAG: cyanophycin synthetase [Betaproteobacteria bacterium]|nr:cyanophycin synthetase [Betaproteobacteria bacterium]
MNDHRPEQGPGAPAAIGSDPVAGGGVPAALDLRILRVNFLRGPNMWTYRSVLEVWLDLGELEQFPTHKLPGFTERLLAIVPGVGDHHCGVGEKGGFLQRLQGGTWMGHVLEHVVIEVLDQAGMPTAFGQTRETSTSGVYRMVFRARDEKVARQALAVGHDIIRAALRGQPFELKPALDALRDKIDQVYLGPSTAHIVACATDREIPHIRLNQGNLVQLGYGARQKRIWTAETDRTSAIAEGIASDKDMTKELLAGCGVPVPEGRLVDDPEDAWSVAQRMGCAVVVKPTDANHGRGVTLDLSGEAEVKAAFLVADAEGSGVMVERYIPGEEHRVLIVAGQVAAAARGETVWITGDGTHTVEELITLQINSDPRRGDTEDHPLNPILVRQEGEVQITIQKQGLEIESVPEAGRRVLVSRKGNMANDCTDEVHPEVAHACALAARIVGLDIAGVDLVCEDISRPLQEQGGAIVEVNAGPGLLMHLKPASGQPREVGRAIVEHLFPEGRSGRIPVVGVTGTQDTSVIARLVAWMLQISGPVVGVACRDGLFVGNRRVERGDALGWQVSQRLLVNRNVEAAVFESNPVTILEEGLVYDRCNVGIVTDCEPFTGAVRHDIATPEQRFKVSRTQVDVVRADGAAVLHAAHEQVLAMADLCDGEVILYGADGTLAAMRQHASAGGRVVYLEGRTVTLARGDQVIPVLNIDRDLRVTSREVPPAATLAAVAAAWALDLSPELIVAGLETFELRRPELRPDQSVIA